MFGFQRVGDLIWAAADSRARGFLLGGTAGRTTLAGEGLQHQDGNSHVYSLCYPNCVSYDPAYAYELAVIIQDGIRRMYHEQESIFYYLTVMNEQYAMPEMPDGVARGHPQGHVPVQAGGGRRRRSCKAQLFGSGAILNEVVKAQEILREVRRRRRRVERDELQELYRDGARLRALEHAASGRDAARAVRDAVPEGRARRVRRGVRLPARSCPTRSIAGCRGGSARSAPTASAAARTAQALREFFEVDARFVALATLSELLQGRADRRARSCSRRSRISAINPEKPNPAISVIAYAD